ncbi:hypothetical protein ABIE82_005458 [Bradyrhizobium diazoefficiens]
MRRSQIPFGGKLLERIGHGVARDPEIARKLSARRQPAALADAAASDQLPELARQLSHQPFLTGPLQLDQAGDHLF